MRLIDGDILEEATKKDLSNEGFSVNIVSTGDRSAIANIYFTRDVAERLELIEMKDDTN